MASSIRIKVVEDNTDKIIEEVRELIDLGLTAVGEAMEGHAKSGCPVDTGRLRDSIVYATSTSKGSPGPKAQAGDSDAGDPGELTVAVGTNVNYAPLQEFGDHLNHKVGGAHFLRNAASNHLSQYKSILEAALK